MNNVNQVEEAAILAEIADKYENRGFFRRFCDMLSGLKCPKGTREYKLARIELHRLAAPIVAIVSVTLFVVVLVVVTAVSSRKKETVEITIAEIEDDTPVDPDPDPESDPPEEVEPQDVEVEVVVDNPTPAVVSQITPVAGPQSEQVTTKPSDTEMVKMIDSPVRMKSLIGGRTTGVIAAATGGGSQYGDASTETAVLKVLWWLKANQSTDGSWKGGVSPIANTALAVLTYLAHNEYPGSTSPFAKDFGPVVLQAIEYLCNCVQDNVQPVRILGSDGNEYSFLIATYALCEAYGMTRNPNCKEKALACLDRIVNGQSPTGGWDYRINPQSTRDDMSFAGWALQALKAGKMAGLHPEGLDACINKAINCLKTRNFNGGGFNYNAGGAPTGLTATGCLAMQLLGFGGQPEVASALDYMRGWVPSFDAAELVQGGRAAGACPQYYCYYATQCKYQAGMRPGATKKDALSWQQWNGQMKKLYTRLIIDDPAPVLDWKGKGHKQGHYENADVHTSRPVMDTCLTALQLMVYYRYLPTNQIENAPVANAEKGKLASVDRKSDVDVEVDL